MSLITILMVAALTFAFPISAEPQGQTDKGLHPFAEDFPQDVELGKVQIRYFIVGEFGGYGDFRFDKSGEHRLLLHTDVHRVPAGSLKAIIYVPGCQITTIDAPDLAQSTPEIAFQCLPLPTIPLSGRIGPRHPLGDLQPVVEIRYMAFWASSFFGVEDGMVRTFEVATMPLGPGAVFDAELPDFS